MTEAARPAWLEGRTPALSGQQFDIGFGTTRIGRSPACPVVIPDPMISREHAEIRYENGAFTIADLGSSHGTVVNGQPVKHAPLFDGTVIRVGHSELTFHLAQEAEPTALVGAGGLRTMAAPLAAPPRVQTGAPPAQPGAPAMAPATAAKKAGGKRAWLIGCAIALVIALCGCAAVVVLSMTAGLPFGLDAAFNQALGGLSNAVTGDGSPPYTQEDLALALAMPTVDERPDILANFGPPDEFEISIVQVEGGQVRREAWRYYGYGTRVDFVDGEIIWTIDLEPGPAESIFPAWYDPLAFETGMTLDEARGVITSASPAGFVPEQIDLSEGGEDLAGGVMLVGDQIMLAFDQGVLVYAETFGVSLEEAAQ
jgi:FHA domain